MKGFFMQINNISFTNLPPKRTINKHSSPKTQQNTTQQINLPLPTTAQYLAFTGGYSLDLADTVKHLDMLAQKKSNVYPPQIREWAGIILEEGNKTKETLINIHKKFYESVKNCFSLEEVKAKFPEFKDVIPSENVNTLNGSFIDDFRNGKLEYFDNDEDLSLQLIKLYWGEGFSINDLRKYADGKDISYVMRKLQIPLTEPTYGKILKLSDPEYNTRLTKEMTEKRMAALDRKAQEATGEPVYIKRGPLSAEHKKHISEGLHRYYEQNPQAVYNLSERQRKFYEENQDRAELLSRVTTKAWYVFGADKIKAAMAAFMKKQGIKTFDSTKLENPLAFTKEESSTLKKFWATNEWARKSFSKNMSYAWKKIKEEQTVVYYPRVAPRGFIKKIQDWGRKQNIEIKDENFIAKIDPNNPQNNYLNNEISKYTRAFVDSTQNESTIMANSFFLALLNVNREISKMDLSKVDKKTRELCKSIQKTIKISLFEHPDLPFEKNQFKVLETDEIQYIHGMLRKICLDSFNPKLSDLFEKQMDKAYDCVSKHYKTNEPIRMNPYGMDI